MGANIRFIYENKKVFVKKYFFLKLINITKYNFLFN